MSPRILTASPTDPGRYRRIAEASWRWVLDQVRWSDGPWIPTSVAVDDPAVEPTLNEYRDGFHGPDRRCPRRRVHGAAVHTAR